MTQATYRRRDYFILSFQGSIVHYGRDITVAGGRHGDRPVSWELTVSLAGPGGGELCGVSLSTMVYFLTGIFPFCRENVKCNVIASIVHMRSGWKIVSDLLWNISFEHIELIYTC